MIERNLGKLESVHGIAPAFLQRAAVIAVLSFVFFLSMLVIFSLVQNFVYFLLATAFLIVELVTLFVWVSQRRNEFQMFENGFVYRKQEVFWREIESVKAENRQKTQVEIVLRSGKKFLLGSATYGVEVIARRVEAKIADNSER